METLLPQLLAFPPHPPPPTPLADADYDRQIRALVTKLNAIQASKFTLGVAGGGDLLEIIDPSVNTISYLYTLLAHIGDSSGKQREGTSSDGFSPGTRLWGKTIEFMQQFNPIQVRYAGNEFRRLIEVTSTKARRTNQPGAAIIPIGTAILRLDPNGTTFTSSHLTFARSCLEAQQYAAALPVLANDIHYFPPTSNKAGQNDMFPYLCSDHDTASTFMTPESGLSAKLAYQDHLLYFLYGAMIYMALKEWERAQMYLEAVIVTPVISNASKIQVEAYKKWVLVNLLLSGKSSKMPHTTNATVAKQLHSLGKPYEALSEVFENSMKAEETNQKLIQEANQGIQFWSQEYNSGLVKQVIDAYRLYSVLRLEKSFAALTIGDIARKTSPDPNDYADTAAFVQYLISTRKLNATISITPGDHKSSIVRLSDSRNGPLVGSEEQQYHALIKQTDKVKILINHVRETDRKLHLSKDYISDAKKRRKNEGAYSDDMYSLVPQDSPYEHDEDMMGDT